MILEQRTQTQQADILSQYLRDDRLHEAKNKEDSTLRKILNGLAVEFLNFRNQINDVANQYNPEETTSLIEEWEAFVGIPDSCIPVAPTLEKRRLNILLKLAGINAATEKQFKTIASILGYNIEVSNGVSTSTFPLTLPFLLISETSAPFTIVITLPASLQPQGFTLTFPFTLTEQQPAILNCLFNKLKPANSQLFFRYSNAL
jgi:uncharacterized protein YmfQ (DUF2313 family)